MKKKGIEKLLFVLILTIFLLSFASSAVTDTTCDIVPRAQCTGGTKHIVMGLSAATNAHGFLPSSTISSHVLCCGFGTGITACSGTNKIIGLSSPTNAHAEIPSRTTYSNSVCYEDFNCKNSLNLCGTAGTDVVNYPLSVFSLTAETNAHIGAIGDYPVKICCNSLYLTPPCEIVSAEWSASETLTGTGVSLIVNGNGPQCNSQNVYFKVREDKLVDVDANIQPTSPVPFVGSIAVTTWTTETPNSNYYFRASLLPALSPYEQSENLHILEEDWCETQSIGSCEDYTNQEYCESKNDEGNDFCNVAVNEEPITGMCTEDNPCSCMWDTENEICEFAQIIPSNGACGDGTINSPNNNGMNEQCDPDSGTDVFNANSNTCQKLSTNLGMDTFTGGTLECGTLTCAFDTSSCVTSSEPICGDNVINRLIEVCDGTNLNGHSCREQGYDGGTLSCLGCQLDKSDCTWGGLTHTECNSGTCSVVPGEGVSECSPVDASCSIPSTSHAICVSNTCILASGTGTNECDANSDCTDYGYPHVCGDGIVEVNDANFDEQCDPSDAPWANGISNLDSKTCASFGGTGSGLSCKSDCTFDYSSCGITPRCGNGIVDQLSEECDNPDLQGATCRYLGFNEGTLSCYNCRADSSSCAGGETGTSSSCVYTSNITFKTCEEGNGKKTISWQGRWIGSPEITSGQAYTNCITPITKIYPCPAQIQLPFFDYLQMIIAILIIAGIYTASIVKSKFKRKNKK